MQLLLLSNLLLLLVQTSVSFTFRDVNIFVVTDTHSWMDAHPHPDNKPLLDGTYGNVTSFITKMKEEAKKDDKDIFFLDNGDVVDGTGLSNASPIDGEYLFPLLMKVPFDAMAIGNHECYDGDVINEMISSNYISSRKGTYLTSNVLYTATMEPLGDRYVVLEGANSGVRLLVLGMLYNVSVFIDSSYGFIYVYIVLFILCVCIIISNMCIALGLLNTYITISFYIILYIHYIYL
mgnify:CR=1 FL=1